MKYVAIMSEYYKKCVDVPMKEVRSMCLQFVELGIHVWIWFFSSSLKMSKYMHVPIQMNCEFNCGCRQIGLTTPIFLGDSMKIKLKKVYVQ